MTEGLPFWSPLVWTIVVSFLFSTSSSSPLCLDLQSRSTEIAGNLALSGDVSNIMGRNARFNGVADVVLSSFNTSELFVFDRGNNKIKLVELQSILLYTRTVAGTGAGGLVDDAVNGLNAVLTLSSGAAGITLGTMEIWFVESGSNTLRKMSQVSPYGVTTIAGANVTSGTTYLDSAIGLSARFNTPSSLAFANDSYSTTDNFFINVDRSRNRTNLGYGNCSSSVSHYVLSDLCGGTLYIADRLNHRIRNVSLSSPNSVGTLAGSGVGVVSAGVGTSAQFKAPCALAIYGDSLYVLGFGSYTLQRVVLSSQVVSLVIGNGLAGTVGLESHTGLASAASTTKIGRFPSPKIMLHSPSKSFLFAAGDYLNIYALEVKTLYAAPQVAFSTGGSLSVVSSGNGTSDALYVALGHSVLKYAPLFTGTTCTPTSSQTHSQSRTKPTPSTTLTLSASPTRSLDVPTPIPPTLIPQTAIPQTPSPPVPVTPSPVVTPVPLSLEPATQAPITQSPPSTTVATTNSPETTTSTPSNTTDSLSTSAAPATSLAPSSSPHAVASAVPLKVISFSMTILLLVVLS